ncbi:hypothetical protein [Soonwooa sp.]|uniref:hypothetical protein n=1 Tax=Soonwooa sp. TaxID=1938592 RepID=UPI0026076AF4|nr:hypothetical protein [Soonwooa sp.]
MKIKNVLLLIILLIGGSVFSQMKVAIPDNGKNVLFNEFWSKSTGNPASVYFYQYFFGEDGRFRYSYGYSGGRYYKTDCDGNYQYNPLKKEIKLHNFKCDKKGVTLESLGKQSPSVISIEELTDNKVVFYDEKNKSTEVMGRLIGMTTDYTWYKSPNSSDNSIRFDIFGQGSIAQESDIRRQYGFTYNIVGNYLFLEVGGVTMEENNERKGRFYEPKIRTYLKINIKKASVDVENIDLYKILDGQRNWTFKNMEFQIEKTPPNNNKTKYVQYTREGT